MRNRPHIKTDRHTDRQMASDTSESSPSFRYNALKRSSDSKSSYKDEGNLPYSIVEYSTNFANIISLLLIYIYALCNVTLVAILIVLTTGRVQQCNWNNLLNIPNPSMTCFPSK